MGNYYDYNDFLENSDIVNEKINIDELRFNAKIVVFILTIGISIYFYYYNLNIN